MKHFAIFIVTLFVFVGCVYAEEASSGVNRLLDNIERAWATHDIQALEDCCCESGTLAIMSTGSPEGARSLHQQAALTLIQEKWADVRAHRFIEREVVVNGDVAWIYALMLNELADGKTKTYRVMNIAVRQQGKWGMAFSMPELYTPAVVVEAVVDGSQAQRLGVQPGDIIQTYADQPIRIVSELLDAIARHKTQPPSHTLDLVVKRAERNITFKVQPGSLGIQIADRLNPAPNTTLYDVDHPDIKVMDNLFAGYITGDINRIMSCVSENGFMAIDTSNGYKAITKPKSITIPIVYNRDGFAKALPAHLAEVRQIVDFATAQMLEPKVIASSDVAVATSRFKAQMRNGGGMMYTPTMLEVYVRENEDWRLAAVLPRRAMAGLDVASPGTLVNEKELKQRLSGKIVGIGVSLKNDPQGARIDNILPDGPAASSDLKPGQVITAVDGTRTAGLDMNKIVSLITGPEGSTVTLEVNDHGNTRSVTLTRQSFVVKSVQADLSTQGVMVIKITSFHNETLSEMNEALSRCEKEQAKAIVLDLRMQGGGQPSVVADVADLFLPAKQRLWITRLNGQRPRPTISKTNARTELPLVVLISENTQGGSELLASALHENNRATLMGQKTKGLARVRAAEKQPNGQTKIVDRGIFLARPRINITNVGLTPDINITNNTPPDTALNKAIDTATKR